MTKPIEVHIKDLGDSAQWRGEETFTARQTLQRQRESDPWWESVAVAQCEARGFSLHESRHVHADRHTHTHTHTGTHTQTHTHTPTL